LNKKIMFRTNLICQIWVCDTFIYSDSWNTN
jgi:hypothetical protein